ncbi:MAG: TonB-dependent receptor, partial [Rhodocyclaceae bacterium]|nr:TonB-dependent receptor [Rhodocyclaceae bacterium]
SQAAFSQEAVQRVEVTGSSIKQSLEQQALPVQIITREDIAKTGAVNIEGLMLSLPSVSAAGGVVKGMGAGNSTYGRSSVSLRGLGDQRTLILVDGRRLAPFGTNSAAVDVNAIPVESIERIDVLTDGASSIYGSDAMAGVINFVTRKDFQGIEASYTSGSPTRDGGGKSDKASVMMGYGSLAKDKFNVMLSVGFESQGDLKASSRDYAKSGNVPPYYTNGATGGGNIEGVWSTVLVDPATGLSDTRAANAGGAGNPFGVRAAFYGNPNADLNACAADDHFLVPGPAAPSTSAGRCFYDSAAAVRLIPKTEKQNVTASARFRLDADNELYTQFARVHNVTQQVFQPSPVRTSFLATDSAFLGSGVSPALLIRPTNPNYPTAWLNAHGLGAMVGQVLAVTQRAFVAGERSTRDQSTQNRFVVGLKGIYKGWDYDTAVSRDQSLVGGNVIDGYFSQLALARALNVTTNNWNPWSPGGVQPANVAAAVAAAQYIGPTIGGKFTTSAWDGRVSNVIGNLAGGEIAISVGGEVRNQRFEISAPPILATGDIAGLGGATLPVEKSRTISSVFSEVNLPILKNLEANVSLRGDRYGDLQKDGSPITGKVSLRYAPVDMMSIRSSYGTGFRAPSLSELYTPETLGSSEQYTDPVAGPQYQANAKFGGNANLVPEKSKQWSIGMIATPIKTVKLNLDYFAIEIDKYVTASTALALVNQANGVNNQYVTFNPDGSANTVDERQINAGLAKFAGFDIGATWSDKFSFGKLTVDYNATRMTKASLKSPDGTENAIGTQVDAAGAALKLVSLGGTIHKYRHKLSLDWTNGPFGATLTQNYTDGYEDGPDLNANRHFVPSYSIYDLQARYSYSKDLNFSVGAKNLLDKDPPVYINTVNYFAYGFDPAQYDPLGRFVYAKVTYKF